MGKPRQPSSVAAEAQAIVIELDGPQVDPDTVNGPLLIELAHTYLQLLRRTAERDNLPLEIRPGIEVVDKCAGFRIEAVEAHVRRVHRPAMDAVAANTNLGQPLARLIKRLPPFITAACFLSTEQKSLPITTQTAPVRPSYWELAHARRVRIIRAGGERPARVRIHDYSSDSRYNLVTTPALAAAAGHMLFDDVLADVEFRYDIASLLILEGRLVAEPVRMQQPTVAGIQRFLKREFKKR